MDRLPALVAAVALVACDDGKPRAGEPPSRVDVAKTAARKASSVEAFCDVYAPADKAAEFVWPALAGAAPAPATSWRWINAWATWCKPCLEEMPRLVRWRDKLSAGRKLDLVFVSVDESEADLAAYRAQHADLPASLRIADSAAQERWFAQLGLAGSPPIPIHVFVDRSNRVRCVRAGGVRDQDFDVVERLLSQ